MSTDQKEIHIEGLPYSWTEDDLKKYFADCGSIESVRMPTWQDSGRSKGYGFITFDDASSLEAALKLHKSEVEGRWLNVAVANAAGGDEARGNNKFQSFTSTPEEDCKTLFVKNLPYDVTEDKIGETFSTYGEIESVRIATDQGRVKGFCYIEFEDAKSVKAVAAASAKGMKWAISDRDLVVDYGSGKPKAGFHPRAESYDSKFPGTPIRKSGEFERRGGKGKGFGGKGKGKGFGGKGKGKGFGGKGKGKGFGKGKGKGKGFRRD